MDSLVGLRQIGTATFSSTRYAPRLAFGSRNKAWETWEGPKYNIVDDVGKRLEMFNVLCRGTETTTHETRDAQPPTYSRRRRK